jgi:hypothetical protein
MTCDGFSKPKKTLIIDRDAKYSLAFRALLNNSGIENVRLPPRSPNLNAYSVCGPLRSSISRSAEISDTTRRS